MSDVEHVLKVAYRAGERVFVHAKGDPAKTVAVGVAAAITMAAVTVGYGSYYAGQKLLGWVRGEG